MCEAAAGAIKALADGVVPVCPQHRAITMGRGDACPVFPGKRYLDWTPDELGGAVS